MRLARLTLLSDHQDRAGFIPMPMVPSPATPHNPFINGTATFSLMIVGLLATNWSRVHCSLPTRHQVPPFPIHSRALSLSSSPAWSGWVCSSAGARNGRRKQGKRGTSFAMSKSDQLSSRDEVVHPRCWWCWKPMVLKRVDPTRLDHYKGKFECETCGRTKKRAIRIKSPSISPAKSREAKQLASAARRVGWLAKGTFTIKGGPHSTIVCTQPNNLLIVFFVIRASWSLKSAGEQQSHRKPRSSENSGARTFLAIVAEGRSAKE